MALECARIQRWLSLPPLDAEDFPHLSLTDSMQEILPVASVSQDLINCSSYPDMWINGNYTHLNDQFDSFPQPGKENRGIQLEEPRKLIEISDLEEELGEKKQVENLRGIKTLHCDFSEV